MSPEKNKNVVQPGTLIVMCKRVRFIWASNTASVIMFVSVNSFRNTEPITEDAKKPNEKPTARSTRDNFHVGQDVSNTMKTDRSQHFRDTASERTSKVLFMDFVQKVTQWQLSVLRNFIKCVITVQPTNRIKCTRCVESNGGKKKLMFPSGRESKERSAIVHTCRTDSLWALGKLGRACSNTITSRQTDGMDAYQIRT